MYSKEEFVAVHQRIKPFIHHTPVLTSSFIDALVGAKVYFKCENFQKMGAFKMRGAVNAILSLSDEERSKGVVTHSSGNFAQAVALAASQQGVKSFIVMPENAPIVKKRAVEDYGGVVITCESTIEARERTAEAVRKERGASFLHPYNQKEVILGQGTACIEMLEQVDGLNDILVPVGGGGLAGGTAMAAARMSDGLRVYGVEPALVDDASRSLMSGRIESNLHTNTIADGLRTTLGDLTLPILKEHLAAIFLVSEKEIIEALRLIYERMKIVVEPSSAVPLAALIKNKKMFEDRSVGVILSGGNVDLSVFFDAFDK